MSQGYGELALELRLIYRDIHGQTDHYSSFRRFQNINNSGVVGGCGQNRWQFLHQTWSSDFGASTHKAGWDQLIIVIFPVVLWSWTRHLVHKVKNLAAKGQGQPLISMRILVTRDLVFVSVRMYMCWRYVFLSVLEFLNVLFMEVFESLKHPGT